MTTAAQRTTADDSSSIGVRLRLQFLSGPLQILAVSALAEGHSKSGSFSTKDVMDLFIALRLPPIANFSAALGRLRTQKYVMNPSQGQWSLTPAGRERLASEAGHVPAAELSRSLGEARGASLGEIEHVTIPPFLAPAGSSRGLEAILSKTPFERNVMLITRFPKDDSDHFGSLINNLRAAVSEHGLVLHVASDRNTRDTLWENVVTHMWACKYAIILMDSADGSFNANVLIEVGGMLMTGRRCAILRDESVPVMPSDLVGHIYKPTNLKDHAATVQIVHDWITADLGLA